MRVKIIVVITVLFSTLSVFSQEEVLLKGWIVTDSLNESQINILNLTRKTGTTNSTSGVFEIIVREQDSLLFSSVQFELETIVITKDILEEKYLKVHLTEKLNELTEMRISNIGLTGNLEKDISKMKVFNQAAVGFAYSNRPAPTVLDRKMNSSTNSPLILLINTLNGRIRMLKKAEEFMQFDAVVDKGVNAVPKEFFVEELKIPEEKIMSFVYFCAEDPEFKFLVSRENHLRLLEYYFEKGPKFLELPRE